MASGGAVPFFERHLGTDLQFASWLLLISTVLFLLVMVIYLAVLDYETSDTYVIATYIIFTISSLIYVYGTWLLVEVSYPEEWQKFMYKVMNTKLDELTWTEKYFSHNELLILSWVFVIATIPLLIGPIWALAVGDLSATEGALYLLVVLLFLGVMTLFVIACMPEHLLANEYKGSSYSYDYFIGPITCGGCCGCCKESLQIHLGTDLLVAAWALLIFAVFGTFVAIYLCVVYYTNYTDWILLATLVILTMGSYLFLYASYPENIMGTSMAYDLMTCREPRPKTVDPEMTALLMPKGEEEEKGASKTA